VAVIAAACLVPLAAIGFLFGAQDLMKLVGFHSEISRAIATERERVSEAKLKAETAERDSDAKIAPPPNAGMTAKKDQLTTRKKVLQPPPPLGPKIAVAPKNDDSGTAMAPKQNPQEPSTKRPNNKEPITLFFELPKMQQTRLVTGEAKTTKVLSFPKEIEEAHEVLNLDREELEEIKTGPRPGFSIRSTSKSGIAGVATLARFDIEKKKLVFTWMDTARSALGESLRDAVLKFKASDGDEYFVILRNPGINDQMPLSLITKAKLAHDDLSLRHLQRTWANKRDELAGTKLPLGIRRWKIESWLRGERFVIAQGESNTSQPGVRDVIIPHEVELEIKIDPTHPHKIDVKISFEKDNVPRNRAERDRELKALGINFRGERWFEQIEKITKRATEIEKDISKAKGEEEILDLRKKKERLIQIQKIKRIEAHLRNPVEKAEISLVISLKLAGSRTLDIAKFGEFAADVK